MHVCRCIVFTLKSPTSISHIVKYEVQPVVENICTMYIHGIYRFRTVLTPYLWDIFLLSYSGFGGWHGGQLVRYGITFVNVRRWILPGTIHIVSRTSILPTTIYILYCILNAVQNLVKLMSNEYVVNMNNTQFSGFVPNRIQSETFARIFSTVICQYGQQRT